MKTLKSINVKSKNVLLRTDFDVLLDSNGRVASDFRIKASLPTIRALQKAGAKQIIIISHLGRPVMLPREKLTTIQKGNRLLSMENVALHLRKLLKLKSDRVSMKYMTGLALPVFIITRGLYLMENIRFDWRESANNKDLVKELAELGQFYVYDAFAVAHREHASTSSLIRTLPSTAGLQLEKEVTYLSQLTRNVTHPYVMVLGGAKIETKMPIIERLIDQIDYFLIGGVMANTFLKAQGIDVGQSVVEKEMIRLANDLYKQAPEKFILPDDYIWQADKILDIGLTTRKRFNEIIARAKMVFWNGTLGLTSTTAQEFKFGSLEIARAIAANQQALTIVSGGDTVGLLEEERINLGQYGFVSTGGGATLEFLSGNRLPALEALEYYTSDTGDREQVTGDNR